MLQNDNFFNSGLQEVVIIKATQEPTRRCQYLITKGALMMLNVQLFWRLEKCVTKISTCRTSVISEWEWF